MTLAVACDDGGPVVSTTPLVNFLQRLQQTALNTFGDKNFDPKLYVDLYLTRDLTTTLDAFENLERENGSVSGPDLDEFVNGYFGKAGEDLVEVEPVDFVSEPEGFLGEVKSLEVRDWGLVVHGLWRNLTRRVSGSVYGRPDLHTLIGLPGLVVVPGSRFREVYYWDSYWVIR